MVERIYGVCLRHARRVLPGDDGRRGASRERG
jgi:hypothetical protein